MEEALLLQQVAPPAFYLEREMLAGVEEISNPWSSDEIHQALPGV